MRKKIPIKRYNVSKMAKRRKKDVKNIKRRKLKSTVVTAQDGHNIVINSGEKRNKNANDGLVAELRSIASTSNRLTEVGMHNLLVENLKEMSRTGNISKKILAVKKLIMNQLLVFFKKAYSRISRKYGNRVAKDVMESIANNAPLRNYVLACVPPAYICRTNSDDAGCAIPKVSGADCVVDVDSAQNDGIIEREEWLCNLMLK